MSYLDDSKETQDNQEPVTQPTQVDPTGIRSYMGAQPAKPTQESDKAVQPIADTTGIPDNVFDELGQDLRNSDPLPPSWVGPTVERWFKDNHPEIQIPEGFINTIDVAAELIPERVELRESMGYASEESGLAKTIRDVGKGFRSGAGFGIGGYVQQTERTGTTYDRSQAMLNEAINEFMQSAGENRVANASLIRGVLRELGIAAEFHAAPSRDRISAREAQIRYESPVARQVTASLQDALQTAFVRSNVAEAVKRTGTRAPDPIQAVFEGLESQGYDVRQEAEGLRIRTPEIEDGTGGRWATISYESLSPGFFGFDNGEQLLKQVFATVGVEVAAEGLVKGVTRTGLAKRAGLGIAGLIPGSKTYKALRAGQTIANIVKMNNRFKRMAPVNKVAFSRMLHSASYSPHWFAKSSRFTGRAAARGGSSMQVVNELYLMDY